jgi:hypothetical protein
MFTGSVKMLFGIFLLGKTFDNGFSLMSVAIALIGLYFISNGLIQFMAWLGSLSKTGSNPSHPQNPA